MFVSHFPALQSGADWSIPAFSTPANSASSYPRPVEFEHCITSSIVIGRIVIFMIATAILRYLQFCCAFVCFIEMSAQRGDSNDADVSGSYFSTNFTISTQ